VSSPLVWVKPCIAVGGMRTALETKDLLAEGVTHILNVSSSEYFKRSHYFTYLNIDVYDNNDEDVKKNFRITNRFLSEALARKGKVLVHD
jgi:protein-tyrosine phosphatase